MFTEMEGLEDIGADVVAIMAWFEEAGDGVWVGISEGMAEEAVEGSGGEAADGGEAVEGERDVSGEEHGIA